MNEFSPRNINGVSYSENFGLTERQLQAVSTLNIALSRMRQEGLGEEDIVYWFQNLEGPYLGKYGIKLYLGSPENKEELG